MQASDLLRPPTRTRRGVEEGLRWPCGDPADGLPARLSARRSLSWRGYRLRYGSVELAVLTPVDADPAVLGAVLDAAASWQIRTMGL